MMLMLKPIIIGITITLFLFATPLFYDISLSLVTEFSTLLRRFTFLLEILQFEASMGMVMVLSLNHISSRPQELATRDLAIFVVTTGKLIALSLAYVHGVKKSDGTYIYSGRATQFFPEIKQLRKLTSTAALVLAPVTERLPSLSLVHRESCMTRYKQYEVNYLCIVRVNGAIHYVHHHLII